MRSVSGALTAHVMRWRKASCEAFLSSAAILMVIIIRAQHSPKQQCPQVLYPCANPSRSLDKVLERPLTDPFPLVLPDQLPFATSRRIPMLNLLRESRRDLNVFRPRALNIAGIVLWVHIPQLELAMCTGIMTTDIASDGGVVVPSIGPPGGAWSGMRVREHMGRCEHGGEDQADEGAKGWEAGADDSNIDFDSGPGRGADVVPCDIGSAGDNVKRVEA